MYKIIAFSVRDEEVQLTKDWAKQNGVDVTIEGDQLSMDNIHKVEGFDGITTLQNTPVVQELYPILKGYGIKQIAQRSAGFDSYDLEAAKENGIIISNVPNYSPESIAEFSLTAALNLVRKTREINEQVSLHDFRWQPSIRARLVNDMTVGIIGTGHIGLLTAKLFKALGANIIAFDLYENDKAQGIVQYVDRIEDLVRQSDIVSLHVPATADNNHQFNYEMFKLFKPDAYLVNAARGTIVNTEDLIRALDDGLLAGAALDTYEYESHFVPMDFSDKDIEDELFLQVLNHDKIHFTPHIAYYTDVAIRNMIQTGLQSTLDVLETGDTENRVN